MFHDMHVTHVPLCVCLYAAVHCLLVMGHIGMRTSTLKLVRDSYVSGHVGCRACDTQRKGSLHLQKVNAANLT